MVDKLGLPEFVDTQMRLSVPIPSNADRDVEILCGCRWLLLMVGNAARLKILAYLKAEFENAEVQL